MMSKQLTFNTRPSPAGSVTASRFGICAVPPGLSTSKYSGFVGSMKKLLSLSLGFLAVYFFIDTFGGDLNTLEQAGRVTLLLLYVTCALLFLQLDFRSDEFMQELTLTAGCMGGMLIVFGVQLFPLGVNILVWFTFTIFLFSFVQDLSSSSEPLPHRTRSAPSHREEIDIMA